MVINLNTETNPYFAKIVKYPSIKDYTEAMKIADFSKEYLYPAMFSLTVKFGCDANGEGGSMKRFDEVLDMPFSVFDSLITSLELAEKVF